MKCFKFSLAMACLFALAIPMGLHAWPIPDTGQTKCYDELGTEIPCDGTGQDGDYLINPLSYTKLDANGNDLDDDATEWFMVRDNVTGLIWEVKQNNDDTIDYSNPHDANNVYFWYHPNPAINGGDSGEPDVPSNRNSQAFISALNFENFGGFADWRLPTLEELRSIVNYGQFDPAIELDFFLARQTPIIGLPQPLPSTWGMREI